MVMLMDLTIYICLMKMNNCLDSTCSMLPVCIVNVGHFRSGTTTLAGAAMSLGLRAYCEFPDLPQDQLKAFLQHPEMAVLDWSSNHGIQDIISIGAKHDIICDGWIALLPFLPLDVLKHLKQEGKDSGIHFEFVATKREVASTLKSKLQHWMVHDLERKAGVTASEREHLEDSLCERAVKYEQRVDHLCSGL